MYKLSVIVVLVSLASIQAGWLGHRQAVNVKGSLYCGNHAAFNQSVELFDDDTGGIDDTMAEGFSREDGSFNLNGYVREMSSIEPHLRIKHNCPLFKNKVCERVWRIRIPDHYIRKSMNKADIAMDLGVWNMEVELPNEKKSCRDKPTGKGKTHRHRRH